MSATVLMDNIILDACLGATPSLLGSSVQIGLSLTAINKDGSGYTEPSGGSYSKVTVTNNGTNFGAAVSSEKTNATEIAFPQATADWGTIVSWFMLEVATGLIRFHGILDDGAGNAQARPVYNNDTFKFYAGELRIKMS